MQLINGGRVNLSSFSERYNNPRSQELQIQDMILHGRNERQNGLDGLRNKLDEKRARMAVLDAKPSLTSEERAYKERLGVSIKRLEDMFARIR